MTVEDIIQFYEDEKNVYTCEDLEKYCDINHVKCVAKPCENVKTKVKISKAPKVLLGKRD